MKKLFKKSVAFCLSMTMLFLMCAVAPVSVSATQSKNGNFNKSYTLTGNKASDIVTVALAQKEKTQSQLGYTEAWCADFVCDCAVLAGVSVAIPFRGFVSDLYSAVINAGGYVTSSPVAGDLCFYKSGSSWAHVSIVMNNSKGTVHGNVTWCKSTGNYTSAHVCTRTVGEYEKAMGQTAVWVHPNYGNSSSGSTSSGYYELKNVASGKYLNIYGNKSAQNTNVDIYDRDYTSGQKFTITKNGNWYVMKPQCSSCVVNVYGDAPKDGANVCLWSATGHSSQGWIFERISGNKYIIRSAYNNNLVLNAYGYSNNSNVCVKNYQANNVYQQWEITPDPFPQATQSPNQNTQKLGDINGDGKITVVDARKIIVAIASGKELDTNVADVNGDGKISVVDARILIVGLANGKYS